MLSAGHRSRHHPRGGIPSREALQLGVAHGAAIRRDIAEAPPASCAVCPVARRVTQRPPRRSPVGVTGGVATATRYPRCAAGARMRRLPCTHRDAGLVTTSRPAVHSHGRRTLRAVRLKSCCIRSVHARQSARAQKRVSRLRPARANVPTGLRLRIMTMSRRPRKSSHASHRRRREPASTAPRRLQRCCLQRDRLAVLLDHALGPPVRQVLREKLSIARVLA